MIKVIISLLNLGYDIILALLFLYFLWYKIVIPWQHRDYRSLTVLSLGLRPCELGQLSTMIPQNHGITITYHAKSRLNTPVWGLASLAQLCLHILIHDRHADRPTDTYILCEILIEHPCVGLASLAQLEKWFPL